MKNCLVLREGYRTTNRTRIVSEDGNLFKVPLIALRLSVLIGSTSLIRFRVPRDIRQVRTQRRNGVSNPRYKTRKNSFFSQGVRYYLRQVASKSWAEDPNRESLAEIKKYIEFSEYFNRNAEAMVLAKRAMLERQHSKLH